VLHNYTITYVSAVFAITFLKIYSVLLDFANYHPLYKTARADTPHEQIDPSKF